MTAPSRRSKRTQGPGKVVLVGAGPGDPDLITVRGAAVLGVADAVVYDSLAARELLDLAPPGAVRIDVGKRGHDPPTRSQPETMELLISLAREGKTVVRLKGGDPFVFGRGGEEAGACSEAGVPFEVVPGVSSVIGALAYAGIPVSDRRYAASFAVVTGHKDPIPVTGDTRWEALAGAVDTLVILMGMRNLESIVGRVLAGGRSPETPAAVVMNGTLSSQRVVEAPLGELVARVGEAGLSAPAVVVIGDVVRLRSKLAWFERLPLFGFRVLVTRPRHQANPLAAALRSMGAESVGLPMLRLVPPRDYGPIDSALGRLGSYDAVAFASANAVHWFCQRARERGSTLAELAAAVFCVGPRTAEAAREAGLAVRGIPRRRFDAEGLLATIEKQLPPAGRRFLLPRAEGARETLPAGLRAAGAEVDAVVVYRTAPPDLDPESVRAPLIAGEIQALTFTSPSAVEHFRALLDGAALAAAKRCWIASIGPVTAEALRGVGLAPDVMPERAGAADLVEALAERVAQGGRPQERGPR
ncbi:MAG: uroporphyrinogen-III C-methyltransferase [Myxococcota bacterium]